MKDVILNYAKSHGNTKKIKRELKKYSMDKINDGYFEYQEVIETLIKKENS